MRMRRKAHLEERAAACGSVSLGWLQDYAREKQGEPPPEPLDFERIFGRKAKIKLEIGCGKGQFIQALAEREPENDFIALEQTLNVLVTAMERTKEKGTRNLRYMPGKAEYLQKVFPPQSVETIYLNFSTPFPKPSYAKHRLTHSRFLEIYKAILAPNGRIIQKTDDAGLFEFSLNSYCENGFTLRNITFDLHKRETSGNIITEYEQHFMDMGMPIYYCEAFLI